jgi:hypothetical protein
MTLLRSLAVAAAAAALAAPSGASAEGASPASGPSTVTVRVEGTSETLLPATTVTTNPAPVSRDGNPSHVCGGGTALGALQLATGGNWNGTWSESFHQYEILSILGETHVFEGGASANYFWSFWLNDRESEVGACEAQLHTGDRVLFLVSCFGEACPSPAPLPLELEAPASVNVGEAVTVTVRRYSPLGVGEALAGATVSGGGASASTDAGGHATLVFSAPGPATLHASAPASIRTEVAICVHAGSDGTCGTSLSAPGVSTLTNPSAGLPLQARALGVREGRRYARRHGPRLLEGTVTVPAGKALREVRVALTRRLGHRCWIFSGVRQRLVRARCGRLREFSVGDEPSFSYLLPGRLPAGSYTYAVRGIDGSGHASRLVQGVSEVSFRVA